MAVPRFSQPIGIRTIIGIVAAISLVRIWLMLNLPIAFIPQAGADDGLYLRGAVRLLSGDWLGPYDSHTLVKGPGYPVFLALSSLSGMPVSVAHALFQLGAIGILAYAILRLTGSRLLALVTFGALAFFPIGYSSSLLRIVRDQIYWPQTLLILALLTLVFLAPFRSRSLQISVSVAAGLCIGWTWLTREEGVWLLPGIAVIALGSLHLGGWTRMAARQMLARSLVILIAFLAVQGAFMGMNRIAYGFFVGAEVKETGYARAIKALQSVDIDRQAYIPVSIGARKAIAEVSPAFAPVAKKLDRDSALLARWEKPGCRRYSSTCGDIAGGWFMWALRAAAAESGFFASPATASQRFGRIADEVEAACASKALPCQASPVALIPPSPGMIGRLPASALQAAARIVSWDSPSRDFPVAEYPAADSHAARMWSFLNHPRISANPDTRGVKLAQAVRAFAIGIYNLLVPALSGIGLLCFLYSLTGLRSGAHAAIFVAAAGAWALVASRIAILALADATSFPAANTLYAAPGAYCVVLASMLSIYCAGRIWLDRRNRRRAYNSAGSPADENQVAAQSEEPA